MQVFRTIKSLMFYTIIVFLALLVGLSIGSIGSINSSESETNTKSVKDTTEKFQEDLQQEDKKQELLESEDEEEEDFEEQPEPVAKKETRKPSASCPTKPKVSSNRVLDQKIAATFERVLDRFPTEPELIKYRSLLNHTYDEDRLVSLLQATDEYHRLMKLQTNLINSDGAVSMSSSQIDMYVRDRYAMIYSKRLGREQLAYLRTKYAAMDYDCDKFESFLRNLYKLESGIGHEDQESCMRVRDDKPVDALRDERKQQDRQPRSAADLRMLNRGTRNGVCEVRPANVVKGSGRVATLQGTSLEHAHELIMPPGKYVVGPLVQSCT